MKTTCELRKTCCICQRTKSNVSFQSAAIGRTRLKPYCRSCAPIYQGIRKGLIPKEWYVGLNYDTSILRGSHYGDIIFLGSFTHKKLSREEAVRYVKQGAAHVISESVIELIPNYPTSLVKVKKYVKKRDQGCCFYCGKKGDTLDHLIPQFDGGLWTVLNLAIACKDCNAKKSNMSLQTFHKRSQNKTFSLFRKEFKKCSTCGKTHPYKSFPDHQNICVYCSRFEKALTLGFIALDKVKAWQLSIPHFNPKEQISIYDVSNHLVTTVTGEGANHLFQVGAVEWLEKASIKLLFTFEQMLTLYPQKTLSLLTIPELQQQFVQKRISVTFDGKAYRKIDSNVANELLKQNLGLMVQKDRIKLLESIESLSTQTSEPLSSKSVNLLTGRNIGYYDATGICLGTLSLKNAKKLIFFDLAKIKKKNRIQLLVSQEKAEKLLHQKIPKYIKILTGTTICIRDKECCFIGNLVKKHALKIIHANLGFVSAKNQVTLTSSIEKVEQITGVKITSSDSFRSIGMYIGKKNISSIPVQVAKNMVQMGIGKFSSSKHIQLLIDLEEAKFMEPFLEKIKIPV